MMSKIIYSIALISAAMLMSMGLVPPGIIWRQVAVALVWFLTGGVVIAFWLDSQP